MKFGEIIKSNNWLSVEIVLLKLYPDEKKNISGYEEVYNKLRVLQPKETDFSILLSKELDLENESYIHVCGYQNDVNNSYAIEFTPWEEWLGMEIDKNTLESLNEFEIIAHCLYEMTFYGFDEMTIQSGMNEINKEVEEIKNMTEEEKKEKLRSWDDLKKEWEQEEKDEEEK